MKFDRILWGILLLFVGGVVLLSNFDVIDFYWSNAFSFLPVFLIILGVNILFNRNNSQTGSIISLVILVVALSVLFVKGQEEPSHSWWWRNVKHHVDVNDLNDRNHEDNDDDDDDDNDRNYTFDNFGEAFTQGDAAKKATLELYAGAASIKLEESTDSLFIAKVKKKYGSFTLSKIATDSANTLIFKMEDRKKNWSGNGNDINMKLNNQPIWYMNLKVGAGDLDFDLTPYKIRTLNFDGGAAEVDIKVGSLQPITDINVKTGVGDVTIKVPRGSACRIKTKSGIASKDFEGFTKMGDGVYETPNFNTPAHKIFINLSSGLSSFEVDRY